MIKNSSWKSILFCCLLQACTPAKEEGVQATTVQTLVNTSWEMDYSMEVREDTTIRHVPPHWKRIKTFTTHRFVFTGYDFEEKKLAGMGAGTYSLIDSVYVENIEFHHRADFNGTQFTGRLYIDSNYLYQSGEVGELILQERWHRID